MTVQKTKDYNLFKFFQGNRRIDENHVKEIMDSLSKDNLLHAKPIVVNQEMEILDGQHRLEAAKRLGLDVFYQMLSKGDHNTIIRLSSTQKGWQYYEHLHLYVSIQHPEYVRLKQFLDVSHMNIRQALALMTHKMRDRNFFKEFKEGKFVFLGNEDELLLKNNRIQELYTFLESKQVKPITPFKQSAFYRAMSIFLDEPEVNWDTFKNKLEHNWYKFRPYSRIVDYIDMLQEVYNWKNQKTKVKIEA